MFAIETSDNNEFLIKITKRDAKRETFFLDTDETERRLHEIYEKYISSWEYDEILMNNDFDIDWLVDILDIKNYRKLENIILQYSSRNNELLFTLGFKYAWSLFMECAKGNNNANSTKLSSPVDTVSAMLREWQQQAKKLENDEISREEYDEWRYRYPELDTSQHWARTPSKEISDYLIKKSGK